jgi:hypothetical protein
MRVQYGGDDGGDGEELSDAPLHQPGGGGGLHSVTRHWTGRGAGRYRSRISDDAHPQDPVCLSVCLSVENHDSTTIHSAIHDCLRSMMLKYDAAPHSSVRMSRRYRIHFAASSTVCVNACVYECVCMRVCTYIPLKFHLGRA